MHLSRDQPIQGTVSLKLAYGQLCSISEMPLILRHCIKPNISHDNPHWPRLQRKPSVGLYQILILRFVPSTIWIFVQMEMANADWSLSCSCWEEPVPTSFQTVAEFDSSTVESVLNIWGLLCNLSKWHVNCKTRMASNCACTSGTPETEAMLAQTSFKAYVDCESHLLFLFKLNHDIPG